METWKEIEGYEGWYAVSNLGRVKALERRLIQKSRAGRTYERVMKEAMLTPRLDSEGRYLYVNPSKDGISKNCAIHTLVLEAFVGPRPFGQHGCHNDGNTFNNTLNNLRWDSPTNNNADKLKHGTNVCGEETYNSKLTNVQVAAIKATIKSSDRKGGFIGRMFGVDGHTINSALRGRSWRHINPEDYKDSEEFKELVATIEAGLKTQQFKQAVAMYRAMSA